MNQQLVVEYSARLATIRGIPVCAREAEDEINRVISDVSRMLSNTQAFGYHEPDDVYQFCYYEALVVLDAGKYDAAKPLENFLYAHLKNRISNLKRAQYFRYEAPCKCCDAFNPGENPCRRWRAWYRTNSVKKQLMRPLPLSGDDSIPAPEDDPSIRASYNELDRFILVRLDPGLVEDYGAFKGEEPLPKTRRIRIKNALRAILVESPYAPSPEEA